MGRSWTTTRRQAVVAALVTLAVATPLNATSAADLVGEIPTTLDCDDASGPDRERETNPSQSGTQSDEVYTCTVRDQNGDPIGDDDPISPGNQEVVVNGENEDLVNDPDDPDDPDSYDQPDYSCTAGDSDDAGDPPIGECEITVDQSEDEVGAAEICFWIGAQPSTECASEPIDEDSETDTGDNTEGNDVADRVEKTWEARSAGEGKGGIDAEPESATNDVDDQHSITVTVYDQFGDPFQGNTLVKLEFFQNSPSDTDGNSPATPDRQCTTDDAATCSIDYTSSNPGSDLACVWTNNTPSMAGDNQNGTCVGEDLNDGDDTAGSADAPTPSTDDVDVVEAAWLSATDRSITIEKNKTRVDRGEFVKIFGEIDAQSSDCRVGQGVRLKARRIGAKFKKIAVQITDGGGEYVFRIRVYRTKEYRAIAPGTSECDLAKSRIMTVRRRA